MTEADQTMRELLQCESQWRGMKGLMQVDALLLKPDLQAQKKSTNTEYYYY